MSEQVQQEEETGYSPIIADQRAFVHQEIKAINKDRMEVLHLISTPATDRAGDIVEPMGADLANFVGRNPIVMVNHSYDFPKDAIGKALMVEVTDKGLLARTKFFDKPLARDAFALIQEGVGGWSIGFRPKKYEAIRDDKGILRGFHFKQWELLEYSAVAIPMNQEVINNMVKQGLIHPENLCVFVQGLESNISDPPADAAPSEANAATEVWAPSPEQYARVVRAARRKQIEKIGRAMSDIVNRYEAGRAIQDVVQEID